MAADCERASAAFVAVVEVLRDDAQMLDARAGHLQHFDPQTIDLDHVAGLWHPVQGLHDQTANGVGTSGLDVATEHALRSEEHTSELQSLMRISYAVFCLKKQRTLIKDTYTTASH